MKADRDTIPDQEEQMGEVVFACLRRMEAGLPVDRGGVQAAHPEFAADLAEFFAARDEIDQLAAPIREAVRQEAAAECGRLFAGYELLEILGQGGMGVVYKARQASPSRVVALKICSGGSIASPDARRFRNEAETVAGLDHPNVVPIYEVGEHDGRLYYTMQLVEGGSLSSRLADFSDRPQSAAKLVANIARVVHFAHQRGVLHRDLKPANVLL